MTPDLSRRVASILGARPVDPDDRERILAAMDASETWDDLPEDIRALLGGLATEPTYEELVAGRDVGVADGR